MNTFRRALLLALAGAAAAARAQEPVIPEDQVTEEGLIDALRKPAVAPPGEGEVSVRSRGFLPAVRATPPTAGRASVLITFATDSADLLPRARAALDVVARALKSEALLAQRFVIEGHADPRGDEGHNERLSLARAQSVVDYLRRTHDVKADRLEAIGFGSSRLMNRTEPPAPENRRVTIAGR